ncbi:hypothetical protein D3C87_1267480 [compost metagenome]
MKVEMELTEKDFERLAEKVIQKTTDELFMKKIIETSEKVAENKYWHVFDKQHSSIEIHSLFEKYLYGIVNKNIKEDRLVENAVAKLLTNDYIKSLGAKRLREIAYQLEKEAEELE